MSSKQLNIVLGIVVVVLLAVVGYMAIKDNNQTDVLSEQNNAPAANMATGNANVTPVQPSNNKPVNGQPKPADPSIPLDKTFTQEAGLYSVKYVSGWSIQSGNGDSQGFDNFTAAHAAIGIRIRYFNANSGGVEPVQTVSGQFDITLGGVDAIRSDVVTQDGKRITRVRTKAPYKGYTYIVDLEDPAYVNIYNAMLPTFKFLK